MYNSVSFNDTSLHHRNQKKEHCKVLDHEIALFINKYIIDKYKQEEQYDDNHIIHHNNIKYMKEAIKNWRNNKLKEMSKNVDSKSINAVYLAWRLRITNLKKRQNENYTETKQIHLELKKLRCTILTRKVARFINKYVLQKYKNCQNYKKNKFEYMEEAVEIWKNNKLKNTYDLNGSKLEDVNKVYMIWQSNILLLKQRSN